MLLKRGGCYYTNVQYALGSDAYKSTWQHDPAERLKALGFRAYLTVRSPWPR